MFRLTFILFIAISNIAFSSSLIDIIQNQSATFEDREIVSKELQRVLGIKQPLPVTDAIAEICYNVDICARSTSNDDLDKQCYPDDYDSEYKPSFGSACYLRSFKEEYTCIDENPKLSIGAIRVFSDLLRDTKSFYNTKIIDVIIKSYKDKFNVDLSDATVAKEFFKIYPDEYKRIKIILDGTIALGSYTGACYGELNLFLFTKNTEKIQRYYNLYKSIINTLSLFPKFESKVNRGVSLPTAALVEHHKVGNIICYDGFTSTAVHDSKTDYGSNPKNYFLKDKCVQRLYISYKDNSSKPGHLIKSGSLSPNEDEVLFVPGSCFRIDSVSPRADIQNDPDDDYECEEGQHYNFEMTLVPRKG